MIYADRGLGTQTLWDYGVLRVGGVFLYNRSIINTLLNSSGLALYNGRSFFNEKARVTLAGL